MKKYIFFTMNIGGINGAEQYIYNKMNYLQKIGYEVFIFSARPEKIMIDGFNKYADLVNPVMRFYPSAINKKERNSAVKWILSVIDANEDDSFIIESSNITSSLWGELIAKELKAKHLVVIMQEKHNYSKDMRDFLKFKYNQHELSGIFDESVSQILAKPDLPFREDIRVRAYCTNVIQECEDRFSELLLKDAEATIGSIGRLEKDYVKPMLIKFSEIFKANPDKKYNLVLIGDSADKREIAKIKEIIGECGNVNLIITGYLYPIPASLINNIDCFASAAGSASASYYGNRPSVRIHHITAEPIGIVGYDYMPGDKVGEVLKDRDLTDCINMMLYSDIEIKYTENFEKDFYEKMYAEFERHLKFGDETENRNYYNILKIKYSDLKYKLCTGVCRIFGVGTAYSILEVIRKLVRGIKK